MNAIRRELYLTENGDKNRAVSTVTVSERVRDYECKISFMDCILVTFNVNNRGVSLRLTGKIDKACVQSVLVYGSET